MHRAVAKKKILAEEMGQKKNSGRLKIPPPSHHFSNGPPLVNRFFRKMTDNFCRSLWKPVQVLFILKVPSIRVLSNPILQVKGEKRSERTYEFFSH